MSSHIQVVKIWGCSRGQLMYCTCQGFDKNFSSKKIIGKKLTCMLYFNFYFLYLSDTLLYLPLNIHLFACQFIKLLRMSP